MEFKEKFCPVCKNKNDRDAVVCVHCGASFDLYPPETGVTTKNADIPGLIPEEILNAPIQKELIPEDGIAVYVAGSAKPVYLRFDTELIFGRKAEEPSDAPILDLTELGGYQMGISRRHAMIRRTEEGYELIDLFSTNGSWLNEERMMPNRPYRLTSGTQLRFGRMRLLVFYNPRKKKKAE
ncbi:MAG: FHA domain-containing protein [Chloroflexota bacterium]